MIFLDRIKKYIRNKTHALLGITSILYQQAEQTQQLERISNLFRDSDISYKEQRRYAQYLNPNISLTDLLSNAPLNVLKETSQRLDAKVPNFVYDKIKNNNVLLLGAGIVGDLTVETIPLDAALFSLEKSTHTNNALFNINFSKYDFIYINSNTVSTILALRPTIFYKMSSEVREGLILDLKYDSSDIPIKNDENNHIIFSLKYLTESTLHYFHYLTIGKLFHLPSHTSSQLSTICCSRFSPNERQQIADIDATHGNIILHRNNT